MHYTIKQSQSTKNRHVRIRSAVHTMQTTLNKVIQKIQIRHGYSFLKAYTIHEAENSFLLNTAAIFNY